MQRATKRIVVMVIAICFLFGQGVLFGDATALGFSEQDNYFGVVSLNYTDMTELGYSGTNDEAELYGVVLGLSDQKEPEGAKPPAVSTLGVSLGLSLQFALLSANEAVVKNYAELKAALQDYSITHIYFDADITMAGNIPISKTRNVVIDGTYNGQRHTLHEGGTTGRTVNIGMFCGGSVITVQNIDIDGYDCYGWIASRNASFAGGGLTVIYDNVYYDGPQLIHNYYYQNSKTVIKDSTINIRYKSGGSPAQEVAQSPWLELEGNVDITHVATDSAGHLFWAYTHNNISSNPTYGGANSGIVIKEGANVTIDTNRALFYPNANGKSALVLEDDAKVSATTTSGFAATEIGFHYVYLGRDAVLDMTLSSGGVATNYFYVNGTMIMQPGSVFTADANATSLSNMCAYRANGTVIINSPKKFDISSKNRTVHPTGVSTWYLNDINAVFFDGSPYMWNEQEDGLPAYSCSFTKTNESNISVSGVPGNVQTIHGAAFNSTNFKIHNSGKQLTIGYIPEGLSAAVTMQGDITVHTEPGAEVIVTNYPNGPDSGAGTVVVGTADSSGNFNSTAGLGGDFIPITGYSMVAVMVDWDGVKAEIACQSRDTGTATLTVTPNLAYGTQLIPLSRDDLLSRTHTMSIRLEDTMAASRDWKVYVKEISPLAPLSGLGAPVNQAFVFKDGSVTKAITSTDQEVLHVTKPSGQINWYYEVDFTQNEGVLISVAAGEVMQGSYQGIVMWTLANV